jgi:hypothetical protein
VATQASSGFIVINNNSYLMEEKTSQRKLIGYRFSEKGYEAEYLNISISELGLNNSADIDIALLVVDNILLVADGVKFIALNTASVGERWQIGLDSSKAAVKVDY